MKKRVLSLVLALVMAASFTACGDAGSRDGGQDSVETNQSKTQQSQEKQSGTQQSGGTGSEDEIATVRLMGPKTIAATVGDIELADYASNPLYQIWAEQLLEAGVQLEVEPIANEQYDTVAKTRLASGNELPDLYMMSGDTSLRDLLAYGEADVVIDILKAVDEYDEDGSIRAFWNTYFPNLLPSYMSEAGALYAIPNAYTKVVIGADENYPGNPYGISIRLDWLEKIGVEYKEMMTVEELKDVLIRFQEEDVNGNGAKDEVLAVPMNSYTIGAAYGLFPGYDVTRGEYVNPWRDTDALNDYVKFMQELLAAGVIETSSMDGNYTSTTLAENRCAGLVDYQNGAWNEKNVPDENCVYAPVIITADGYTPQALFLERAAGVSGYFVIPSDSKNVKAVVTMLDTMYTEEFAEFYRYGREGVDYQVDETGSYVDTEDRAPNFQQTFGTALPMVQFNYVSKEFLATNPAKPQVKNDFYIWTMENYDKFNIVSWDYTPPMMTEDERAKAEDISSDLWTYQDETITKLILGEYDLNDLDDYVAEMDKLGMADQDSINQARLDRYISTK